MNHHQYILYACILLLIGCSCSPASLEDFRKEGEVYCRELFEDLRELKSYEDLVKKSPVLRKRFELLVDLMIEARHFQKTHPEESLHENSFLASLESEELLVELKRIYALQGGREIIERCQKEALARLDAFEREITKQNQKIPR